jgi:hypothetical protein
LNGFEHPYVNEATTEHAAKFLPDFVVGRLRILVEKRFRGEDHSTQTEATLRRFFINESLLNGMRLIGRAQAFQRYDLRVIHSTQG